MSRSIGVRTRQRLTLLLALCLAVPATLSLQGCCSTCCTGWCNERCAAQVVTFWEKDCPPGGPGLTATPGSIKVKRGQVVRFINGSRCELVVTARPQAKFTVFEGVPDNRFTVRPGDVKELTVSRDAPVAPGVEFPLDVESETPGCRWCPGWDGPGVEIDE